MTVYRHDGQADLFSIAYLIVSFLVGLLVVCKLFPSLPPLIRIAAAFLTGLLLSGWTTFLLALPLARWFSNSSFLAAILASWYGAIVLWVYHLKLTREQFRLTTVEIAVLCLAFLFSFWLFDQGLSFDHGRKDMVVSYSTWGDFGLHLALARSFSLGNNLPPQYPFFAGPPIHYHFGYDFIAGVLERVGMRLDLAMNLPAALSFTAMLVLVFELARLISGSAIAGGLAAFIAPLSTSFAFRDYVRTWRPSGLSDVAAHLWNQGTRLHIGPYDGQIISIHFTLNPYLNQRQLALGIAFGLLVVYIMVRAVQVRQPLTDKQAIVLGALFGLSFPLNGVVYLASLSVIAALFLLFRRVREGILFLIPAIALAAPVALLLSSGDRPSLHVGYLAEPLTVSNFLRYWLLNIGLLLLLILAAFLMGSWHDRRLLLAFSAPFIAGNLIQLSPDLSGINHKLFNLWIVLMAIYGGITLYRLASYRPPRRWFRPLGPLLAAVLIPPLVFSGIIDLMVVKNDRKADVVGTNRSAVEWIAANTPAKAVFLTAADLYMPPSYAGRRLYIGIPVFTGVAGYDVPSRLAVSRQIYSATSRAEACSRLIGAGIDYVQVGPAETHPDSPLGVNPSLWAQFSPAYDAATPFGPLRYYQVQANCRDSGP